MAREAGFMSKDDSCGLYAQSEFDGEICWEEYAIGEKIRRFEALVRADEQKKWQEQTVVEIHEAVLDEREACAKVCEELFQITPPYTTYADAAQDCADAIRASKDK